MEQVVVSNITGVFDVLAMLTALGKAEGKIVAKANRVGAKIIKIAAEGNAPILSGLTRKNVRVRVSNKPFRGVYRAFIGVGAKDWTGPTFYASFVLWGHRVGARKLGNARKLVPANDWLKRSADQVGQQAADAVVDEIKKGIEAEAQVSQR
jgi:HK97 gp10 family phage protein